MKYWPWDFCGYTNHRSIDCTKKAIYAAQPAACQTCGRIDHQTVQCKYPCDTEVKRSQPEEPQESEIEYDDSSILEPDGYKSYPQSNIMLGLRTNLALVNQSLRQTKDPAEKQWLKPCIQTLKQQIEDHEQYLLNIKQN
uniref:Uncharacterized protein n=1 Tax=Romanomermis culicivorax TaxID=13658 RepID=A0A915I1R0_ROMCU